MLTLLGLPDSTGAPSLQAAGLCMVGFMAQERQHNGVEQVWNGVWKDVVPS